MQPGILILTRHPQTHAIRRLQAAAESLAVPLHVLDPHSLQLLTGSSGSSVHLTWPQAFEAGQQSGSLVPLAPECVLLPRLGSLATEYSLAALAHLELMGTPTLCTSRAISALRHKFTSLGLLAQAGVPVPESIMLRSPTDIEAAVERLGGYPVVLKFIRGSQGLGVVYCADETATSSIIEAMNFVQYDVLLQRYYPSASTQDVRVLVLEGRARWAIVRSSAGGRFRSNFHRGGTAQAIGLVHSGVNYGKLAQQAVSAVENACGGTLGLAGVDIIHGDSGPMVLEVNSSPGFEALEAAHGCDCASEIIAACRRMNPSLVPGSTSADSASG